MNQSSVPKQRIAKRTYIRRPTTITERMEKTDARMRIERPTPLGWTGLHGSEAVSMAMGMMMPARLLELWDSSEETQSDSLRFEELQQGFLHKLHAGGLRCIYDGEWTQALLLGRGDIRGKPLAL